MRRKFELEEDMRTVLQATDNAGLIRYPLPVAVPHQEPSLPSPVPGFMKPDQHPAGYWANLSLHDGPRPTNVAGHKGSPSDMLMSDIAEWLGPTGTYPTSSLSVAVSHSAPAYSSFDLAMSAFQPSSHSVSSLYSLVANEPASIQHRQSPTCMTPSNLTPEAQMLMPHQVTKLVSLSAVTA